MNNLSTTILLNIIKYIDMNLRCFYNCQYFTATDYTHMIGSNKRNDPRPTERDYLPPEIKSKVLKSWWYSTHPHELTGPVLYGKTEQYLP